ncbi:hypothetical protein IL306_006181 [Fusarium sp. DS 682]|nr:hypothetical protein IL306_006181 [Fusarium sp. DS 682]
MATSEQSGIGSVVSCQPEPDDKAQSDNREYQETHLRKRFTLISTIAFGFTTMNSWVAFASGLAVPLSCAVQEVKQPSKFVFKEFTNVSGWTDGWAAIIGIASCLWAYCGIDAPSHLSEEVDNPSRNIPIAIGATIILGIITVIAWNIGLIYVIKDIQGLIASGAPILEVYNQALGSKTATTIWAIYYILVFYHIILNLFVFSSRIMWSFARDGGVPYSGYVSRLRWSNPVRATAIMLFLQIIIGILYIASKTAYSSFINLTLFALNITVVLPQSVLLFTGRDTLPKWAFSLGRYGYLVNALATVFMLFFSVVFAFPVGYPVTGSSMNYLVVIFAISLIFIILSWVLGLSKRFTGPSEGTTHI